MVVHHKIVMIRIKFKIRIPNVKHHVTYSGLKRPNIKGGVFSRPLLKKRREVLLVYFAMETPTTSTRSE